MTNSPRFARRFAVVTILAGVAFGSTASAQTPADPAPQDPLPVDVPLADVAPLADVPASAGRAHPIL